ncbi:recombinase [Staphylococcus epidermidis]|nr:recombinase [Staphylococcus epidermidis]TBW82962.1 recombinase [Staphylococcus epidermidis]
MKTITYNKKSQANVKSLSLGFFLLYKENHALCVWFRKGFTVI